MKGEEGLISAIRALSIAEQCAYLLGLRAFQPRLTCPWAGWPAPSVIEPAQWSALAALRAVLSGSNCRV